MLVTHSQVMSIPSLSSVLSTAQTGIDRGVTRLNHAAAEIAEGKVDAKPFIDMLIAEKEVEHNARVVHTADEMHKSLLDILA